MISARDKERLLAEVQRVLIRVANENYDPSDEETIDSDGLDQAARDGVLEALTHVEGIIKHFD